jgi:hypothetical protein
MRRIYSFSSRLRLSLVVSLALLQGPPIAQAQTSVEWHRVTIGQPVAFALNPPSPTTTNTVSFVAPTDGRDYINSCFASAEVGAPDLRIDPTNQTITVVFLPVIINGCPNVALPVNGVDGKLGLLRSGTWLFSILTNTYTFNVVEAPLRLSIQTLSSPSSFKFEWPVSADSFELQFTDNLTAGVWQELTNSPITVSNENVLQIQSDSTNRLFRLRRLN